MGIKVDKSTISRLFKRLKLTRKRVGRRASQRSDLLRGKYMQEIAQYSPDQLCFVDESAVNEHTTQRRWGYGISRHKVSVEYAYNRTKRQSLLPLLSYTGFLAFQVVQESYTEGSFNNWIQTVALPAMNPYPMPNSVLIMDNAPIHNEEAVRAMCTEVGIVLVMLPPYSPDFNPIENALGVLKRYLQSEHDGTATNELQEAIADAIRCSLSPEVVRGIYRGCGYKHVNEADEYAAELRSSVLMVNSLRRTEESAQDGVE